MPSLAFSTALALPKTARAQLTPVPTWHWRWRRGNLDGAATVKAGGRLAPRRKSSSRGCRAASCVETQIAAMDFVGSLLQGSEIDWMAACPGVHRRNRERAVSGKWQARLHKAEAALGGGDGCGGGGSSSSSRAQRAASPSTGSPPPRAAAAASKGQRPQRRRRQ